MIRLVNIDNIELYKPHFKYQTKRRYMTEEERIKEDIETDKIYYEIYNMRMKIIRDARDKLLAKSDYYFNVPDIKINEDKKEQILKYREELRDFPNKLARNEGIIFAVSVDKILENLPKL
jgi:hypothetical protein